MPDTLEVIAPKTPGLLTRTELADYLHTSRNAIPSIIDRFGLVPVEDRFAWRVIWRQVLGLEPDGPEQEALLRQSLQPIDWVAARIGKRPSTVRNRLRAGRFAFPAAVELGDPKTAPRSRRWIPASVLARCQGIEPPAFKTIRPLPARAAAREDVPDGPRPDPVHSVFARIVADSARTAEQRRK